MKRTTSSKHRERQQNERKSIFPLNTNPSGMKAALRDKRRECGIQRERGRGPFRHKSVRGLWCDQDSLPSAPPPAEKLIAPSAAMIRLHGKRCMHFERGPETTMPPRSSSSVTCQDTRVRDSDANRNKATLRNRKDAKQQTLSLDPKASTAYRQYRGCVTPVNT